MSDRTARQRTTVAFLLGVAALAMVAGLAGGVVSLLAWIGMGLCLVTALVLVLTGDRVSRR